MSADKTGWRVNKLEEVCSLISRGISPKYVNEGGIRVVNQRCVRGHRVDWSVSRRHDETIKSVPESRFIQYGDGLINSTGTGTLGRVAQILEVVEEPTTVDSHVTIVRPRSGLFCPEFFGYMLIDIEEQLKESGEGCGGQTELARTTVATKFDVRYPASLEEQERIVAILDQAFAGIAAVRIDVEANLGSASILTQCALERRVAEKGRTWLSKPLAELCDIKHGFAFKSENFRASGEYTLLTPGNFYESGGYRNRGEKQKFHEGEFPRSFLLQAGDLLLAMTEQAAGLLGSPIIVPENGLYLHNQRLGLVKSKSGVPWSNAFFFQVFNTSAFRAGAHQSASGVKVRHTSPQKLGEITVPFPNSLEEQNAIVARLDELSKESQRLQSVYHQKLTALAALKQSLLHQAFSGNL